MSAEEHEQFSGAKQAEVDKFVAAEALQALPPHLRPNRSQALRMRWVSTWKKKEDGTLKPKARAVVVLGFLDPDYANRPTFAPTMTRQSRQVPLQWAANHKALVHKTREMYLQLFFRGENLKGSSTSFQHKKYTELRIYQQKAS